MTNLPTSPIAQAQNKTEGTASADESKPSRLFSLPLVVVFCGLFLLASLHYYAVATIIVGLAGYALKSRRDAVQALSLMVVIKYLNPALCDFPPYSGVLFWGVTYAACLSFLVRMEPKSIFLALPVVYFYVVVLVLSFWSSSPLISILKATSFCGVVACLLTGYGGMSREDCQYLGRWFFSLAAAVLFASLPTLFFRDIGFHRNGRGFQGILNHPQAFGIFWPPFILWLTFDHLFSSEERSQKFETTFMAAMIAMVFASRARTGMAAVLVGFAATICLLLFSQRLREKIVLKRGLVATLAVVLCFFAAFAAVPAVRQHIGDYLRKGEQERTVDEALYHSRGRIIVQQWERFLERPWTGHGFGVYAEGYFPGNVKTFAGIPISASVEKGITVTAVLEEIGILGTLALLVFLFFLLAPLLHSEAVPPLAMFMGCLGVNFGEAVFFSLGGNGLFYWLLMGWCWACARTVQPQSPEELSVRSVG